MAISIDWATKVITVPKADTILIQTNPTEIRELDLNVFRMALKNLEDDEAGILFPNTHNHNTEVSLGGITFARVIEIINGYTVTFEDGQYAVNLVGANSNVGDVVNVNQVSVRSANSAGLISNPAIEYSSFGGGVSVDFTSPYTGTLFPVGTPQQPVNNWADAYEIAAYRGFYTVFVIGSATLGTGDSFDNFQFQGESKTRSVLTIEDGASVESCNFYDMFIQGYLDGNSTLIDCRVGDLFYVQGCIDRCVLNGSHIELLGNAIFLDSFSGNPADGTPEINLGGSGKSLILKNYNGKIKLKNKSGTEESEIDLNSGIVELDDTITNGTITVRGVGEVQANGATATLNIDNLVNPTTVKDSVYAGGIDGSVSLQNALQVILAALAGPASGGGTGTLAFQNQAKSKNVLTMSVDENGNRSVVILNTD